MNISNTISFCVFFFQKVRHGEFQFKVVRLEAQDILDNSRDLLNGELLYIATDEQNKSVFFKPMMEQYTLKFLDDYFQEAKLAGVSVSCEETDTFIYC